jgi:putative ABC transport system permease protein
MRTLLQDIHYGLRMLARAPGFTAVALLTLALGIGANTAIFSVVNPILFQALPYPDADRVIVVGESGGGNAVSTTGWATIHDIEASAHTLSGIAGVAGWSPTITGSGDPEMLTGQSVSRSFFPVLGVSPFLGRNFEPADDVPGAPRVAILGHGLWRRRFGADSGIVGHTVMLSGAPYTVIGVMPRGFENVLNPRAQLWRALSYDATLPYACRTCRHLRAVARVKPDLGVGDARRELAVLSRSLVSQYPRDYTDGLAIAPLHDAITSGVRPALLAILGAVGLVLLITCANVMSLLLARASQRETEFAIRAALGAGNRRVVRQLLTESLLLAVIGGSLGLLVAQLGIKALIAMAPSGLPRLDAIHLDAKVLIFTLLVATAAGVLFGIAPALAATRSDLHGQLKQDARRTGRVSGATRGALVVSEVAIAVMLLVGAGLLLRSLGRLLDVKPGFETEHLLTLTVQTAGPAYRQNENVWAFYDRALESLRALPGVKSADAVNQIPLGGDNDGYGVHSQEKPRANPSEDPSADRYGVTAGYLATMGIPLIRGRALTEADNATAPAVLLVNEAFAKREWPGEDPIGQHVRVGDPANGPWRTIVGIVGDVHHFSLEAPITNQVYLPESQSPYGADNAMDIVVRTTGDPVALAAAARAAIRAVDPDQPIIRIATMDQIVAASTAARRFALVLFESFAAVALLLAAAGIYGVLAGAVAQRTREIGIRSALGASRGDILGMIVRQGAVLTGIGILLGTVGALALSSGIDRLLFGIGSKDPVTFGGVATLLAVVALAACAIPAWRAARVDPLVALRSE